MSLKTLLFITVFFCCGIVFSQQTEVQQKKDSIHYFLEKAKGKNELKDLSKAVELAEELQLDSLIMVTNVALGLQSFFKKNTDGLDIAQQNLNKLYLKFKDSFALAKVYHYKALIHLLNYKKDSSLYYYIESKKVSALIKDSLEVGRRLLSMSNVQRDGNDYLGSELSAIEGLQYLEPIKDYRYTGSLYNSLGISARNTNKQKEARKYFNKYLKITQKNPNKKRRYTGTFNFYNNSALSYVEEKNYDKAIELYNKALKMDSLEFRYPKLYAIALGNLSIAYISKGEFSTVLERLKVANKIKTRINDVSGLASNQYYYFLYYSKINAPKKALYYAKKALEYSRKSNYTRREISILLSLANSKFIQPKEANIYLRSYIKLNDSILENEKTLKNQFAKIRYETGKKEKENLGLKVENDKKQLEIEQEKQQKIISFLLTIGSLLFLGISFLVFKNRRKKTAFENQLQKAEAREHERQQIAKSLHDEVAGDLRTLHQQLEQTNQVDVANKLGKVKNNVRNLSHQLSSVHFNEVTFKDQIINLISDYFSLECKITIHGLKENDWTRIANPIKRTLYLSARESLQNAKKHAKATQIKIDLKQDKNNVYLTIEDNGVGFDFAKNATGIGLKNQRERIEELNGNIEIISVINKGTILKIEIPINV
jgi:signal transduction histidine kinase